MQHNQKQSAASYRKVVEQEDEADCVHGDMSRIQQLEQEDTAASGVRSVDEGITTSYQVDCSPQTHPSQTKRTDQALNTSQILITRS